MACRRWFVLGLLVLVGCDEKKPPPAPTKNDPKTEAKSATDAKLEAAMAAASAKAPAAKKTANQDGPPENGIFTAGAADKLMPLGAPPKIELVTDGAEPRSMILSSAASWKGNATITTGMRLGPRNALPSVEYLVGLGPEKKDKKDKDADAGAAGPLMLLGNVESAKLAAEQPGKLPDGVQKEIGKLKGSQLLWKSDEQGVAREPSSTVSKEAPADLQRSLDVAAEVMFYLSVPPPPKPVGVGAAWIAGSRQVLGSIEVISYRLYKVKSISPDGVQLTVESKEYAANDQFKIPGLPPNAPIGQFEGTAQGEITLPAKEALAIKGTISRQITLGIKAEQAPPGSMMGIQFASEATVNRSAKK